MGVFDLCSENAAIQTDIFSPAVRIAKRERLNAAVDRIRERFGYTAINSGRVAADREFFRFDARLQNEIHPVGLQKAL